MRRVAVQQTALGLSGLLLVALLLGMVNYLSARHWIRADWTTTRLYSLSEKTLNLLKNLDQDVRVVVFMTPEAPLYEQVRELLTRYQAHSDRIQVEYIDPEKEPLRTRKLAQEFGISVADTVVFSVGDRSKYVTANDMAEFDYTLTRFGRPPRLAAFKGEAEFSAAILSLVAPRAPKVYFITGHGEVPLSRDAQGRGLSRLQEALRRENIQVGEVSLLGGKIPEDADVLAIVGPRVPFTDQEIQLLRDFLEDGGSLLVCVDPLVERGGQVRKIRLEGFLEDYGVALRDDLVVDPARRLPFFDLSAVYLTDFQKHPVTQGLEGLAVLFPVTRSVGTVSHEGMETQVLIETTSDGWGERNLRDAFEARPISRDEGDTLGPVSVAVAVEGKVLGATLSASESPPQAQEASAEAAPDATAPQGPSRGDHFRLVVFGDSDFLTDAQIVNAGNLQLAVNALVWLAQREEQIGIPPRQVEQVHLFLDQDQIRNIFLISLLGMPGAGILLGIWVWWRRRY